MVQRVSGAQVRVGGRAVGSCGAGLLALVAAERTDGEENALKMADKLSGLRVFSDADGKMNLALGDVGGSVLAVSNFTVAADTVKSRRPSFVGAAPFEEGHRLFELMVARLQASGVHVETGEFGAHMEVELVNDGPVTVLLET